MDDVVNDRISDGLMAMSIRLRWARSTDLVTFDGPLPGGQFAADSGGQLAADSTGQFEAENDGQFRRIFQLMRKPRAYIGLIVLVLSVSQTLAQGDMSILFRYKDDIGAFWVAGDAFHSWRVYEDRIASIERIDSLHCVVNWFHLIDEGGRRGQFTANPDPALKQRMMQDDEIVDVDACRVLSLAINGTKVGEVFVEGEGSLQVELNARLVMRAVNIQGSLPLIEKNSFESHYSIKICQEAGKSFDDHVQDNLPPVIINDPRISLATYTERNPSAMFSPDGKIWMSTLSPFLESIPITPGLIDAEIGESILRTTKFDVDLNIDWSIFVGPSGRRPETVFDDDNNAYHVGSASGGIWKTTGRYQESPSGQHDAFVGKWTDNGVCEWYTYVGGSKYETVRYSACDSDGNIYVLGETYSEDFPTLNALQPTKPNNPRRPDAFLFSLAPDGKTLRWSTYLGSKDKYFFADTADVALGCSAYGLIVNETGVYVSFGQGWPEQLTTTDGAYQSEHKAGFDAWLGRFSHDGALDWSTLVNTFAGDVVTHMFEVLNGDILLLMNSVPSGIGERSDRLPVVGVDGHDSTGVGHEAFVFRFTPSGTIRLVWSEPVRTSYGHRELLYDRYGNCFSIAERPFNKLVNAVQHQPNDYWVDPSQSLVSVFRTTDYVNYDTLMATPMMGSYPNQLSVHDGKLLAVDIQMPSTGACLTDTSWTRGLPDAPAGVTGYMVVLNEVVTHVDDESDQNNSDTDPGQVLKLIPNPASRTLIISIEQADSPVNVVISNLQGRILLDQQQSPQKVMGVLQVAIDVSQLPIGAYLVGVRSNQSYSFRFFQKIK